MYQTDVRRIALMNRMTGKFTSLNEMLAWFKQSPELMSQVTYWHTLKPREAKLAPFPQDLHAGITGALQVKGINQLYTHQAESYQAVRQGKHIVTVTPTASGKTLCYNLPVLQGIIED